MDSERREFHRVGIICKITVLLNDKQLVSHYHTENLSVGGTMVIMEEATTPSTVVDLELSLWYKKEPLKFKGKIIWVNEIMPKEVQPRFFHTGIQFAEISDADEAEIKDFVNTTISDWQ